MVLFELSLVIYMAHISGIVLRKMQHVKNFSSQHKTGLYTALETTKNRILLMDKSCLIVSFRRAGRQSQPSCFRGFMLSYS